MLGRRTAYRKRWSYLLLLEITAWLLLLIKALRCPLYCGSGLVGGWRWAERLRALGRGTPELRVANSPLRILWFIHRVVALTTRIHFLCNQQKWVVKSEATKTGSVKLDWQTVSHPKIWHQIFLPDVLYPDYNVGCRNAECCSRAVCYVEGTGTGRVGTLKY